MNDYDIWDQLALTYVWVCLLYPNITLVMLCAWKVHPVVLGVKPEPALLSAELEDVSILRSLAQCMQVINSSYSQTPLIEKLPFRS